MLLQCKAVERDNNCVWKVAFTGIAFTVIRILHSDWAHDCQASNKNHNLIEPLESSESETRDKTINTKAVNLSVISVDVSGTRVRCCSHLLLLLLLLPHPFQADLFSLFSLLGFSLKEEEEEKK